MTNTLFKQEKPKAIHRDTLLYYIIIGVFFAMVTVNDQLGFHVPSMLYTLLWLFVIVYFNIERAAAFTVSAVICFASSLSVTIPIAAFVVMAFLRGIRKVYIGVIYCGLSLILAEMTHFSDASQNFRLFVNTAMFIVLVVVIVTLYLSNDFDPTHILKHYIGFFIFLATDILVFTIRQFGSFAAILDDSFRIGQTNLFEEQVDTVAMSINANGLAFLALMAVGITLALLNYQKISKRLAITLVVYCSLIGFLTISKTFVLCFALLVVIYYFWYLISTAKHFLSGLMIFAVILLAFYLFSFTELYQNIAYRFENSDLTTGRTDLIWDYMQYMSDHPEKMLFGLGLQRTNAKAGFETVPHNAFLETYVCLGIVGLIAAILLVADLFRLFRKKHILQYDKKPVLLNYFPLIVYLVFIQTFQFIKISYIFVPLSLVCLCIILNRKVEPMRQVKFSYEELRGRRL